MINTIFELIDNNLQQLRQNPKAKLERIDLDRFYPDFVEGRLVLPRIKPYHGALPQELVTFIQARAAYNKGQEIKGCICHYIDDKRFQCVYRDPVKYIPLYQACGLTIDPDFSLYVFDNPETKRLNVFRNHLLTLIWQHCGIEVIPNVSWAEPYSFDYCFEPFPQNCVVAFNSTGCRGNYFALYYWWKGFEKATKLLTPAAILRYGPKMNVENEAISRYYDNPHLKRMRASRKK